MKIKSLMLNAIIFIALVISVPAFAVEDASMHEIYSAAEAGRFGEAQTMMDKVLQDHPNSAKAHYVEAELLAKQGKMRQAKTELNAAEKLQPGLPFAKPDAVEKLKSLVGVAHNSSSFSSPISSSGTPWEIILLMIGLIAFMYFAVKMMTNRNPPTAPMNTYGNNPSSNSPINAQPYGAAPMMNPTASGGIGSGILSGLATGAAVGAGMVAGEALIHHFVDGNNNNGFINDAHAANNNNEESSYLAQDDMGGNDFGIADNTSWDDGTSGSDDWT